MEIRIKLTGKGVRVPASAVAGEHHPLAAAICIVADRERCPTWELLAKWDGDDAILVTRLG